MLKNLCFAYIFVYIFGLFRVVDGTTVTLNHHRHNVSSHIDDKKHIQTASGLSAKRFDRNEQYFAMCLISKNDHLDIVEWIEYHKRMGCSKFYLFDHNSTVPMLDTIRHYVSDGLVEYFFSDFHTVDHPQMYFYQICLSQFSYRHRFMAFVDSDEFIVVANKSASIPSILKNYEQYGGLTLNWKLFGSSGHVKRPSGGVLPNYNKCGDNPHIKTIVNCLYGAKAGGDPHSFIFPPNYYAVDTSYNRINGPYNINLTVAVPHYVYDIMYINHYTLKSAEDFQRKVAKGRADGWTLNVSDEAYFKHANSAATPNTCEYLQMPPDVTWKPLIKPQLSSFVLNTLLSSTAATTPATSSTTSVSKQTNKHNHHNKEQLLQLNDLNIHDFILNNGSRGDNYFLTTDANLFGQIKDIQNDTPMLKLFNATLSELQVLDEDASDHEAADVLSEYFWGKTNGIFMELGAVDGTALSQSKVFEDKLGWHRILIEGAPAYREGLYVNSKNAFAFNCAICETAREVHYVSSGAVGGIIEFMTPSFISHFHKDIAALDASKWTTLSHVQKIGCFPLNKIISTTQVMHINVFILDVEGGEYSVLHSIDFDLVQFDVIIVEVDAQFRPVGYEKKVSVYLAARGYKHVRSKGRNAWFQHYSFVPSVYKSNV